MKTLISQQSGYSMIVSGNIPKLSISYLKSKVVDRSIWSDLFTNKAKECLELAIKRHLSGLGANVASQVFSKFQVTDEVLKSCRKFYQS